MKRSQSSPVLSSTLVAMELGASWPEWMDDRESFADARVLAEQADDVPGAFAERVVSRLEAMTHGGARLRTVVLACNDRADDPALAARRTVVRSAASIIASRSAGGAVYLSASQHGSGACRAALANLATDASLEWQGAPVTVGVRFGGRVRDGVAAQRRVA